MRRKAADRAKDLDLNGGRWRDNQKRHGKRERKDASSHGETVEHRTGLPAIPDPESRRPGSRIPAHTCLCLDRLQDVARARQDPLLEDRGIGDRAIERRDALHRRVEVVEQLVGDARGDLGAEAARQLILVRDDDAAGLLRVGSAIASQSYGMIVRRSITATLMPSFSACCAASSERCTSAPQVTTTTSLPVARARRPCRTGSCSRRRDTRLVVGLAVEVLVLEEQHRVVAADRRAQQAGRVLRVRGEHDADARAVREDATPDWL